MIPAWPDMVYANGRYSCDIAGELCHVACPEDNPRYSRHATAAFKNYADRKAFWAEHSGLSDDRISELYSKRIRASIRETLDAIRG